MRWNIRHGDRGISKVNEEGCTTSDPAVLPEFLNEHRAEIVVGVIGLIVSCLGMAHETDTRPSILPPPH